MKPALLKIVSFLLLVCSMGVAAITVHSMQARPNVFTHTQPTSAPLPSAAIDQSTIIVRSWKPKIAFQYYDGDEPSSAFLATRIDWLMMRYGAEQRRNEVYKLGYDQLILQYVLAYQVLGPGPYTTAADRCAHDYTPLRNNVAWTKDFCQEIHPHEDWFLHNSKGERLYSKWKNWDGTAIYSYYMNPGSKGFRDFWVEQIKQQRDAGWKGFFLDNVGLDYRYLRTDADNQDGDVQEYRANEEWQAALIGFIAHIRTQFPDYPIWANMIEIEPHPDAWEPLEPYVEGFFEENFATNWIGQPAFPPEVWEQTLSRIERALARGKGVVVYAQGTQDDQERMRFALASYLLIATADEQATFRYADADQYHELWWYPEYDLDLGQPKGKRYHDGKYWGRDFQCGHVRVDPIQRIGQIEQRPCQS